MAYKRDEQSGVPGLIKVDVHHSKQVKKADPKTDESIGLNVHESSVGILKISYFYCFYIKRSFWFVR